MPHECCLCPFGYMDGKRQCYIAKNSEKNKEASLTDSMAIVERKQGKLFGIMRRSENYTRFAKN